MSLDGSRDYERAVAGVARRDRRPLPQPRRDVRAGDGRRLRSPTSCCARGATVRECGAMRFANPAGLALLALAIPVCSSHILRPRRTPMTVSSVLLWQRVERPVSAAQPWQRLRWSLLLLAQLLAVVLLAARRRPPASGSRPRRSPSTPCSSSTPPARWPPPTAPPTAWPTPGARAEELRDELPDGGVASIVVAGDVGPGRPDGERRRRRVRAGVAHDRRDRGPRRLRRRLRPRPEPRDRHDADRLRPPVRRRASRRGGRPAARPAPASSRSAATTPTVASPGSSVEPRDGGLHARVTVRNTAGRR